MKIFTLALLILFASCTYNQDQHIKELLTKSPGPFPQERDRWIVEQSLQNTSAPFHLQLEPLPTPRSFLLKGDQFPLHERLIFAAIDPANKAIDPRFEFEVEEEGAIRVIDRNGIHTEKEIPFVACEGLVVGKPIVYAVVSKKNFTIATAEFIPYPLETITEDGASISLVATHPMLTRFQVRAKGFLPQEKIRLIHHSGKRKVEVDLSANPEGAFSYRVNPTILGRLGGDATLKIIRGSDEITLDYPWGAKLEKRTFEERSQFPILFVVNQPDTTSNDTRISTAG